MPLYIAQSGDLDRCYRCLTHSQTLKDIATQLLIKYKSGALVTQLDSVQLVSLMMIVNHLTQFNSSQVYFATKRSSTRLKYTLLQKGVQLVSLNLSLKQRPKKSEPSGWQNLTYKNFPGEVCKSFSQQKSA